MSSAYTESLNKLVEEFGKLPGIGPKTAERLAFYILKTEPDRANALAQAIENVKTKIISPKDNMPLKIKNIIIFIHIFAVEKNNYNLGPYFSDNNGESYINKHMLEISTNSELETDLMGHRDIKDCSSQVEIEILSEEAIKRLIEGRKLWGITKQEIELYGSKEHLLEKIEKNSNSMVESAKILVDWDERTPSNVTYEIKTMISKNK